MRGRFLVCPDPLPQPGAGSSLAELDAMSLSAAEVSLEQSTEDQLVERAQLAVSSCRWVVGECAARWTERYARGRTDGDFAALVGLTPDQIFQRRRVWETFHSVRDQYTDLKWSHFYAALTWDDSGDCLQWAEETKATVAEMKAWRRARRGEDLEQPAEEEGLSDLMGAGAIQFVPDELSHVMDPGPDYGTGRPSVRIPGQMGEGVPDRLAGVAREVEGDAPYTPFRADAAQVPGKTAKAPAEPVTTDQLVKRMTAQLERFAKVLTPAFAKEFRDLPTDLQDRFMKAVSEFSSRAGDVM